ncbi:tyrosine-type recombinase/integrase [Lactobacillus acetotolerans]|uniref:tyrosine-type recombinase/integrase n=1 Tax=Lactobacillus acetotolerans TaxID=1600 RepID=UPI00241D61DA|nr:tyrosine-type recombinase/integrase [Lactobacillus acetotolerans]
MRYLLTLCVFAIPRTELPSSSSAVNQFLRRTLDQGNIHKQDFHFHSLRHTHVAYLLSKGVDISAISKRLGHANIATTLKIYAQLLKEYENNQNDKILKSLNQL